MKLIKPSFLIKEQESGLDGIYKQIEWAGRHCYKSHDKITEDSAKEFVERMIKSGHGAMLEHGTVYLKFYEPWDAREYYEVSKYIGNKYSKVSESIYTKKPEEYGKFERRYSTAYVTTNLRVLVENGWLDDLKYLCEPTEYHDKRVTVRFICDRGVSHKKFVA